MERPPAKTFEDLVVWQKAHQAVLSVYRETAAYPKEEVFGLTAQWRRAAISVPANIAEGFSKRSKQDKARFLNIAQASLEECRYYAILGQDLGYANGSDLLSQFDEVGKLITAYTRSLLAPSS